MFLYFWQVILLVVSALQSGILINPYIANLLPDEIYY